MKQWTKAIIADVALAILAIFLFSPTQLALSPLAPNLLVAASSVIGAVGIGAAAVKVNGDAIKAMRAEKRLELGPGEATVDDIKMALQEYEKTTAVGVYARQAIAELEAAERKEKLRLAIVPDILVGAHALECADALITRDRGFMRRYFSKLKVIDPSSGK